MGDNGSSERKVRRVKEKDGKNGRVWHMGDNGSSESKNTPRKNNLKVRYGKNGL